MGELFLLKTFKHGVQFYVVLLHFNKGNTRPFLPIWEYFHKRPLQIPSHYHLIDMLESSIQVQIEKIHVQMGK